MKESVPPTFLSYAVQLNFSLSPTSTVKQLGVHSVVEISEDDSVYVAWAAAGLQRGLIPDDGRAFHELGHQCENNTQRKDGKLNFFIKCRKNSRLTGNSKNKTIETCYRQIALGETNTL